MDDIKRKIVEKRVERMALEGPELGHAVPPVREAPLAAFDRRPFVICEVKRRSPSRGTIDGDLDAVGQARRYVEAGVKTISVLTEEDSFGGSLADLMAVKRAFPHVAVLRKDFLVSRTDLDVSWRAGADAVLLIASILDRETLADLKSYAESLGLAVFLEVHGPEDVEKVRTLKPLFTGINSRDLTDFSLDRALPLKTRAWIDWPTRLVFESGIFRVAEAEFAAAAGFQGVLVGEGAVRNPELPGELVRGFRARSDRHPAEHLSFWARLYARHRPGRPLVKICGLTRSEDVRLADSLGADALGFILAPSPRQVPPEFLMGLGRTRALKVGVVVLKEGEPVPAEIQALVLAGYLDALQFHGQEAPDLVDSWGLAGYKALSLRDPGQLDPLEKVLSPRILLDAFVPGQAGGTGTRIPEDLLGRIRGRRLWLAGGLGPDNIGEVVRTHQPELVDASSGLERAPGIKDPEKMQRYFEELDHACV